MHTSILASITAIHVPINFINAIHAIGRISFLAAIHVIINALALIRDALNVLSPSIWNTQWIEFNDRLTVVVVKPQQVSLYQNPTI